MTLRNFPLLLDENISLEIAGYLRENGFIVESILEGNSFGQKDIDLLLNAHLKGQVILTHDSDFGTLIFRDKFDFTGILYLRPGHFSTAIHIRYTKSNNKGKF